jgi:hypothetical protein
MNLAINKQLLAVRNYGRTRLCLAMCIVCFFIQHKCLGITEEQYIQKFQAAQKYGNIFTLDEYATPQRYDAIHMGQKIQEIIDYINQN